MRCHAHRHSPDPNPDTPPAPTHTPAARSINGLTGGSSNPSSLFFTVCSLFSILSFNFLFLSHAFSPIRKKILVWTVIVQFNKAVPACHSVRLTLQILNRWKMELEWKRDRTEMQYEKRPEFNRNKTWCCDESAIVGSLFILPSATVENTDSSYRDWQPEWLTANTTVLWGEKCVFYQAESSAKHWQPVWSGQIMRPRREL